MEQSEFSMEQDDAGMVNDILKELSKEDNSAQLNMPQQMPMPQQHMPMNQQQMPMNQQQMPMPQQGIMPMPESLGQNTVHPGAVLLNQNMNDSTHDTKTKQVTSNPWWKVILSKIKKPITLTVLIYLVFNPLTRRLLNKHVPVVFRSTSYLHQNISIIILSVIVGISFTLLNKLL